MGSNLAAELSESGRDHRTQISRCAGDLRSNAGAGSGDPRTTCGSCPRPIRSRGDDARAADVAAESFDGCTIDGAAETISRIAPIQWSSRPKRLDEKPNTATAEEQERQRTKSLPLEAKSDAAEATADADDDETAEATCTASAPRRQPPDPFGRRYITQPYTQLASVYRAIGQDEQANDVLVARAERIGELAPPFSAQGLWYRYLGRLIGYGYEPFRAIKIGLVIIAVGAVVFAVGAHRNLMSETKLAERVLSSEDESGIVSPTYPRFNAIVYSLDVFLPFVDLNQVCYWIPGEKPAKPRSEPQLPDAHRPLLGQMELRAARLSVVPNPRRLDALHPARRRRDRHRAKLVCYSLQIAAGRKQSRKLLHWHVCRRLPAYR